MKLNQLVPCDYDVEICGLSADSREIRPGFLFGSLNGSQYLESAINNGAAAVIVPENDDTAVKAGIAVIPAANPNLLFARAAAKFTAASRNTSAPLPALTAKHQLPISYARF